MLKLANGKNGCEYGRWNRNLIGQIQESHKRTQVRIDQIMIGLVVAIGSIWLLKVWSILTGGK